MVEIESKDELLRFLLCDSTLDGGIHVDVWEDTRVEHRVSDELEAELREVLSDE